MRIITVSDRPEVFKANLGKSKILQFHPLSVMDQPIDGIPFNIENDRIHNDEHQISMFVHDDVFLPDEFELQLVNALYQLPDNWAVLGVAGASFHNGRQKFQGHIKDRGSEWLKRFEEPQPCQTVDELLIIINEKHEDLHFDYEFPFDFYGADLCMQAHERGLGVYVIPAFVHHNSSRKVGERTPSFYESEAKFREKWKHRLPIATTCSILK